MGSCRLPIRYAWAPTASAAVNFIYIIGMFLVLFWGNAQNE